MFKAALFAILLAAAPSSCEADVHVTVDTDADIVDASCYAGEADATIVDAGADAPVDAVDAGLDGDAEPPVQFAILAEGDSLTTGIVPVSGWPQRLSRAHGPVETFAISGSSCEHATGRRPFWSAVHRDVPRIMFDLCGTNNIASTLGPTVAMTRLTELVAAGRAEGMTRQVVETPIDRVFPASASYTAEQKLADLQTFKSLIRAYPWPSDVVVIDNDEDPHLGPPGAALDPIYFASDHTHLTDVGQSRRAARIQLEIDAFAASLH